jgi:hypothetical protein
MELVNNVPVFSIKNFYKVNSLSRFIVNRIIDYNYKSHFHLTNSFNCKLIHGTSFFFDSLYDRFLKECQDIFGNFTIADVDTNTCYAYRSNSNNWASVPHHHKKTATITSVYYHQLVENQDSISFFDKFGDEHVYYPSMEELVIFPSHLLHQPNPPSSKRYRYSINMELKTEETSLKLFSKVLN